MAVEDSAKLLEFLADLILDKFSRGVFDSVVRVRAFGVGLGVVRVCMFGAAATHHARRGGGASAAWA